MLNHSSFYYFLTKGNASKRLDFFNFHKEQIFAYLLDFLLSGPLTVYREFILNETEGQERVRVYLESFEAALAGNVDAFLNDQKQIGYIRAMEGYHLNDVYGFTVAFKDALWLAGKGYNNSKQNSEDRLSNDDIYALNKLLDGSFYFLSLSFLETRDEIITRHREQLQALQLYAAGVVSVFEEEDIWARTTQGVFDVFGLNGTFFLTCGEQYKGKSFQINRMIGLQVTHRHMGKFLESICQSLAPMGLDNHDILHPLSNSMDTDQFRFVASPLMDRKNGLIGVLCVHDQGRTFRFSKFDRNLFRQLSSFTGAVSTNCRILSEIAEKKEDLRNLTARLISAQEEERKKIAADIHDVLTQALTGIGYKALYCMEIASQDIDHLHKELEMLTETINAALRQSRQIIGNLRPHILDDIGIIAAFRKLIEDFREKFAIDVQFSHPDDLQINPDKGIALFRILQEALHNARRHDRPTTINLSLSFKKNVYLLMRVQDDGKGFDPLRRNRQRKRPGLGLLTMRERAEDIGGEFQIISHPGEGCMIIVKIPL